MSTSDKKKKNNYLILDLPFFTKNLSLNLLKCVGSALSMVIDMILVIKYNILAVCTLPQRFSAEAYQLCGMRLVVFPKFNMGVGQNGSMPC